MVAVCVSIPGSYRAAIVKLPDCVIVGAPKAGSTSLYAYLGQHPYWWVYPGPYPQWCWGALKRVAQPAVLGDLISAMRRRRIPLGALSWARETFRSLSPSILRHVAKLIL